MPFDLHLAFQTAQRMAASAVAAAPRLLAALALLGLSTLAGRALRSLVRRLLRDRPSHSNLRLAIGRLVYAITIGLSTLIAATIAFPSFTVGSLIQLLGVSGVVIGFAFKDIFQNFLAGMLILITNEFSVDDQIVIDGIEGTVVEIQTRATLIRTYDHRVVVVPNADLFTHPVTVNTAYPKRRTEYDLELPVSVDVHAVKETVTAILHSGLEGVEQDPRADVLLLNVNRSTLTLRLRWWSASERGEYLVVKDRVLQRVREELSDVLAPVSVT